MSPYLDLQRCAVVMPKLLPPHHKLTPEGGMCPKHFNTKHSFSGSPASMCPVPWALPAHACYGRAFNPAQGHAGELTQQWALPPSECHPLPTENPSLPSLRDKTHRKILVSCLFSISPQISVSPETAASLHFTQMLLFSVIFSYRM